MNNAIRCDICGSIYFPVPAKFTGREPACPYSNGPNRNEELDVETWPQGIRDRFLSHWKAHGHIHPLLMGTESLTG